MQVISYRNFIHRQPVTQVADFATWDGCYPCVRPVILICHNSTFWIATGARDAKVVQIKAHQHCECLIHTSAEARRGYIRLRGAVALVQDASCKTALMQAAPFITNYFQSAQDPDFALLQFTVCAGEALPPGDDYPIPFDMHG
jgi:general stress protein 26